jgi:hypothetical protein
MLFFQRLLRLQLLITGWSFNLQHTAAARWHSGYAPLNSSILFPTVVPAPTFASVPYVLFQIHRTISVQNQQQPIVKLVGA